MPRIRSDNNQKKEVFIANGSTTVILSLLYPFVTDISKSIMKECIFLSEHPKNEFV
jgi:hypothetical protein